MKRFPRSENAMQAWWLQPSKVLEICIEADKWNCLVGFFFSSRSAGRVHQRLATRLPVGCIRVIDRIVVGLNEKRPTGAHFNVWCPGVWEAMEPLGGKALLKEVLYWGVGFKFIPSRLPVCN